MSERKELPLEDIENILGGTQTPENLSNDELKRMHDLLASRNTLSVKLREQVESIFKHGTLKADETLIVGDMHLEHDYNKSMHVDYADNCRRIMKSIIEQVKETKATCLIFLGDFIGVKVGVGFIKNRYFFQEVLDFMLDLMDLGVLVLVLRGNHDLYQPSDYEFLEKYGFFLNPSNFKDKKLTLLPSEGNPDIRFELHFVQYGDEQRDLRLVPRDDVSTVVLAHNNFYVRGHEEFYVTDKAIDVTSFLPFTNADAIYTGDIHVPSSTLHEFVYSNGNEGSFMNLGCPTRPQRSPKYDYVYLINLGYDGITPKVDFPIMELPPYDETFVQLADSDVMSKIDEINRNETDDRKKNLENVLKTVGALETNDKDYFFTIDSIAYLSDNVKELAKSYIRRAKIEN